MADAIEIAKAIANNNGRTQYVGRVPSDLEVLAYALLAQQAVVEAAEAYEKWSDDAASNALINAARALRETKR